MSKILVWLNLETKKCCRLEKLALAVKLLTNCLTCAFEVVVLEN